MWGPDAVFSRHGHAEGPSEDTLGSGKELGESPKPRAVLELAEPATRAPPAAEKVFLLHTHSNWTCRPPSCPGEVSGRKEIDRWEHDTHTLLVAEENEGTTWHLQQESTIANLLSVCLLLTSLIGTRKVMALGWRAVTKLL